MQIGSRCYLCQLKRIMEELKLSQLSPELEFRIFQQILQYYSNSNETRSAILGYKARSLLTKLTKNPDPYKELKIKLNNFAETQLPIFEKSLNSVKTPQNKFRLACLGSVLGNLLEFFLLEHSFKIEFKDPLENLLQDECFAIDNSLDVFNFLKSAKKIMILPDNAGEIYFDKILIKQIKAIWPEIHIIIAVKSSPILNDATLEDAKQAMLEEYADEIITTGTNSIGLFYENTSTNFQNKWKECDLIIEKGMGHFETSDLLMNYSTKPIFHLFRVKCTTVADMVSAELNNNIALLKRNGNHKK